MSASQQIPRPSLPGKKHLVELYDFAWERAKAHVAFQAGLPSERYMDEGFEPGKIWQWDSCFMALFCRYAPGLLPGIESIDNLYGFQRPDGYIAMSYVLATGKDSYSLPWGRINPPLYSWVEWEHFKTTGAAGRLPRILPILIKYDSWIEANRRRGDGSYWFEDGASSGMDNSPRTCRRNKQGNDVSFVDLAAQQTLSALCLSRLAAAVADTTTYDHYRRQHQERAAFINRSLWCERDGFYHDKLPEGLEHESYPGYFSSCKTVASFWPMLAEAVPQDRIDALVSHLLDEGEFKRPNPVPTLSFDNPNYHDDGHYWQGGVWAPTNYMIVKGLGKCGRHELARSIAEQYLECLWRIWKNFEPHTLWECYAPEYDEPARNERGEPCRPDFCGWTALGPICMLLENILGFDVDGANGKVNWRLSEQGPHGVRGFRVGKATADILFDGKDTVKIVADHPIRAGDQRAKLPDKRN